MAKRKTRVDPKKLLLVGAVLLVAFVAYRKHQAGQSNQALTDQAVPYTPSGYFYADPFGGAGAASYGGGTASAPVSGTGGGGGGGTSLGSSATLDRIRPAGGGVDTGKTTKSPAGVPLKPVGFR